MVRDIAVFVGDDGQTVAMNGPGTLRIYRKHPGDWVENRELLFMLDPKAGLPALRQEMARIIQFLGDCRVVAAGAVAGVPYFELEKARCSIWEMEGEPVKFLDLIYEKEISEQEEDSAQVNNTLPVPVETSPGCFFISLKEIQSNSSGFTSKQVLRPFLQRNNFKKLEVLCSHLPPWLEIEMENGKYSSGVNRNDAGELRVVFTGRGR